MQVVITLPGGEGTFNKINVKLGKEEGQIVSLPLPTDRPHRWQMVDKPKRNR